MPDRFEIHNMTKITLKWRYYFWLVFVVVLRTAFPDYNWRPLIVHMMRRCCKVQTTLTIKDKGINESDDSN